MGQDGTGRTAEVFYRTWRAGACGPGLLSRMTCPPARYFVFDPTAVLPLPCLQTGRRAGVAVITAGLDDQPAGASRYLTARSLTPGAGIMTATVSAPCLADLDGLPFD